MYKLNFERWVDILLSIPNEGCSQADISKKTNTQYSHIHLVTKELVRKELLFIETDNNNFRKSLVTITKKGKDIRDKLLEIKKVIESVEL